MCAVFQESKKNIWEWYMTAAMQGNWPKENKLVNFLPVQPPNTREKVAVNDLFHPRATPLRRLRKHNTTEGQEMGHNVNL